MLLKITTNIQYFVQILGIIFGLIIGLKLTSAASVRMIRFPRFILLMAAGIIAAIYLGGNRILELYYVVKMQPVLINVMTASFVLTPILMATMLIKNIKSRFN